MYSDPSKGPETAPASCRQMLRAVQYGPGWLARPDSRTCTQSCHPHLGSVSGGALSRW